MSEMLVTAVLPDGSTLPVTLRGGVAYQAPDPWATDADWAALAQATRTIYRRTVDKILADDAIKHPRHTEARRAAILAYWEHGGSTAPSRLLQVVQMLKGLVAYAQAPTPAAKEALAKMGDGVVLAAYERALRGPRLERPPVNTNPLGSMSERWGLP